MTDKFDKNRLSFLYDSYKLNMPETKDFLNQDETKKLEVQVPNYKPRNS